MVGPKVGRQPARWACAVVGGALVLLFGAPVLHAWARGTVPYDLHGLSWSTVPGRLPEMVGFMLAALGLVALVAATFPAHRSPLVAAVLLTALIAGASVQIEPVTPALLLSRLLVVTGGALGITALIAAVTPRPSPEPVGPR